MNHNKLLNWTLGLVLMFISTGLYAHVGNSSNGLNDLLSVEKVSPKVLGSETKAAEVPTMYANMFVGNKQGICSFLAKSPEGFKSVANHDHLNSIAGTYANGRYYSITTVSYQNMVTEVRTSVFDAETWKEVSTVAVTDEDCKASMANDLTYDPVTGKIFGSFHDLKLGSNSNQILATLNTQTGKPDVVGNMGVYIVAMACTAEGQLYGLDDYANLYSINKETAAVTKMGNAAPFRVDEEGYPAEFQDGFLQSATFDYQTGKLYWTGCCNTYGEHGLMEIDYKNVDPKTQFIANKVLVDFGVDYQDNQLTGLFIKQTAKVGHAVPRVVTDLTPAFDKANLTGELSFVMPSTNTANEALKGDLTYTIYLNDQKQVSKTAAAGAAVKESVTAKEGEAEFKVIVSQGKDESASASKTIWVGQDTPMAVQNPYLYANGMNVTVSWVAPKDGVHSGYVGELTYKVVRQPDNVVVADNHKFTSFQETITDTDTKNYSYDVYALAGGKTSEVATSNEISLGSIIITFPWTTKIDSKEIFDTFTVVDANKDGSKWDFSSANKSAFYQFNAKNKADDWLITPGVKLEASKLYVIRLKASNEYPEEKLSISFGKAATAEGMVHEILAPTAITYDPRVHELSATALPDEDGIYYFGIKACSEANMSTVYVSEVTISAVLANAPAAVSEAKAVAGEKGALNATLTFKAPTKNILGEPIKEISEIIISRNKQEIHRMSNVTVGETYTYKDETVAGDGLCTYTITAVNAFGKGEDATVVTYVGVDVPGPVENFTAVEDLNNEGTILLNWEAPTKGQHGGYIDPAGLTYFISAGLSPDAFSVGKKTSYKEKVDVKKGQVYQGYSVYAENKQGSGRNVWVTQIALAGPAMKAPYFDSFSEVHFNGPWLVDMIKGEIGEARWTLLDGTLIASNTHDGDGGVLSFTASYAGASSRIKSPKIDIRTIKNPMLTFWVYFNGKKDELKAEISGEYGEFKPLQSIKLNDKAKGWHRFELPLNEYKNFRFIQVAFAGKAVSALDDVISVDNVAIQTIVKKDLEVINWTTPSKLKVGEEGKCTIVLRNSGSTPVKASDYKIELYKNDVLANTFKGRDLGVDQRVALNLKDAPTINDTDETRYQVVLVYEGDENMGNNKSRVSIVRVIFPLFPTVTDLSGEIANSQIELSWSEPNVSSMQAEPITDHFEDYKPFAIDNYGKWKVYDGDQAKTIQLMLSLEDGPLQYENAGKPMAFQVFNVDEAGIPLVSWNPYSGSQMLVAFKCVAPQGETYADRNDDWLISPQLNGKAQTISFYAKAGMAASNGDGTLTIPEVLQVWYSTTDDDVKSFEIGVEAIELTEPKKWQEVRVELPEGSQYFALRCISDNKFALMIDDISYVPAGAVPEDVVLQGYNLYKNGKKLNRSLLAETYYDDADVVEGKKYAYKVTAQYDKGESIYSNEISILYSASSIKENEWTKVVAYGENDFAVIQTEEAMKVSIFAENGTCVYSDTIMGTERIALTEGIYFVNVDGNVAKVMVR